jgi:hypothetical protein
MGYRYEVAIAMKPEVYNNAPQEVKEAFSEIWQTPSKVEDDRIVFHHDYIKWYDDDLTVKTIMEFLHTLNYNEFGMLILGEEDSDIEYLGDVHAYGIDYIRRIQIDC